MGTRGSKTDDYTAAAAPRERRCRAAKPKPPFSEFEIYLLVLRLLRETARSGSEIIVLLGELEKSESGGHAGRVADVLARMVEGGYIKTVRRDGPSEAFALTADGRELICTAPQ